MCSPVLGLGGWAASTKTGQNVIQNTPLLGAAPMLLKNDTVNNAAKNGLFGVGGMLLSKMNKPKDSTNIGS
jgi:hypothetical protein